MMSGTDQSDAMIRSRVKDHVTRFIRQSQELGTTLGLIKEQAKDNLKIFSDGSQERAQFKSVKQSMIRDGSATGAPSSQHCLSPQKILSSGNQPHSLFQKSQFELLSAINQAEGVQGIRGGSIFSGTDNLPEYEIVS